LWQRVRGCPNFETQGEKKADAELLTDEQVYKEVLVEIAETGVIDVNYYDVDDWFQHEKEWVAAVIAFVYPLTQLP